MIASGRVSGAAYGVTERQLVELFVFCVVPLHMLFPRVGGWLMVLAALAGVRLLVREPFLNATDRAYLLACAAIPVAYAVNMSLTGWDLAWLHRPAHLLVTGGLIYVLIGRVGIRYTTLFWSIVLGAFTTLAIALFDVLVMGSVRVSGLGQRWNAVPFGNFALLLGCMALAGCISELFSSRRDVSRLFGGLLASFAGVGASILTATRGAWLAFPVVLLATLILSLYVYRWRVVASRSFLALLALTFIGGAVALQFSDNAQGRIVAAVEQVEAWFDEDREGPVPIDSSTQLRLDMWRWGIEQFSRNPWTGIGLANYDEAREEAVQSGRLPPSFRGLAGLHNELITALALGGLPVGFAVVLFWILAGRFFVTRVCDERSFFFALCGVMVVVGTAMFSMTEGLFGTSAGTKAFALLLALSAGALRYRESRAPGPGGDATDLRHA